MSFEECGLKTQKSRHTQTWVFILIQPLTLWCDLKIRIGCVCQFLHPQKSADVHYRMCCGGCMEQGRESTYKSSLHEKHCNRTSLGFPLRLLEQVCCVQQQSLEPKAHMWPRHGSSIDSRVVHQGQGEVGFCEQGKLNDYNAGYLTIHGH